MNISKGKWTAWDDDGTGTLPCVLSDKVTAYGNFYVAQCHNFPDARAIAEVPNLIEALHNMLVSAVPGMNWTDESGQMMLNQAREILKRIEG